MSRAMLGKGSQLNGLAGDRHGAARPGETASGGERPAEGLQAPALRLKVADGPFEPEGEDVMLTEPSDLLNPAVPSGQGNSSAVETELARLRAENTVLLEQVANLEQLLTAADQQAQLAEQQQKDMERLLEEKSDLIRELHIKAQDLQARPPAATPREEELLALSEELEQERLQLKEDEETLTRQMRDMELQMSRERAELARKRADLQRLHNELRHELEAASREAELRDRLQPLQRRHQELAHRKGGEPPPRPAAPVAEAIPEPAAQPAPRASSQSSGLLRRIFGQ